MMNSFSRSYKRLEIPHFKEICDAVGEVMAEHNIRYYLIGVNAMALELLKGNVKPGRGTKDIDFAINISAIEQYEELSKALINKGFNKVKAPWTFYSEEYRVTLDILPFGDIEKQIAKQFSQYYPVMHFAGLKEVLEKTEQVWVEDMALNIPSLTGMVILKLIAWSDRPEERENDLVDILRIITHYFDHKYDVILEHHPDILNGEEFDRVAIGAEVLGRNAGDTLKDSGLLKKRISRIIEQELQYGIQSKIARSWAQNQQWTVQYALKILGALGKGISGT